MRSEPPTSGSEDPQVRSGSRKRSPGVARNVHTPEEPCRARACREMGL